VSAGDLLRASVTVQGLEAPAFAWVAALLLPLAALASLGRLAWVVRRELATCRRAAHDVEAVRRRAAPAVGQGLDRAALAALRRVFEPVPALGAAWRELEAGLLADARGIFACQSAEATFSDAAVVAPRVDRAFHLAVPGVVTGLGLLVTFLAILVALLDVRLEATQVRGLDTLIRGLSGKFVSSIAALAGASACLLLDKPLLHALDRGRRRLVQALDAALPRLTPAHLLVRLEATLATEAGALRATGMEASRQTEALGAQLGRTQAALEALVALSHRTTEEQAALRRRETEELGQLVRALLARTEERASATLTQLATALTGVVQELASGVSRLQADLGQRLSDGTEQAASAVQAVLGEAERWSAGASGRLHALEQGVEALLGRVQGSLVALTEVGAEFRGVTCQLGGVAATFGGAAQALTGAAEQVGRASDVAARAVERLAASQCEQAAGWARIDEGVRRYQDVFAQVERSASDLLGQVAQHLTSFTDTTRRGLSDAIGLSHDYLADATGRLRSAVDDLDEHLQALRDVLDEVLRRHRVLA
jgi:hypothetical protein